jgi:hypothetical protein
LELERKMALPAPDRRSLGARPREDPATDREEAGQPGRPDQSLVLYPSTESSPFPDTPLGRRLAAHMEAIGGSGEDAEATYQASLAALREHPTGAVELLFDAYQRAPEEAYLERWAFAYTIGELHSHLTLVKIMRSRMKHALARGCGEGGQDCVMSRDHLLAARC